MSLYHSGGRIKEEATTGTGLYMEKWREVHRKEELPDRREPRVWGVAGKENCKQCESENAEKQLVVRVLRCVLRVRRRKKKNDDDDFLLQNCKNGPYSLLKIMYSVQKKLRCKIKKFLWF